MAAKSLNGMTAKQAARGIIHSLLVCAETDSTADLKEFYPDATANQLNQVAKFIEADINRIIVRFGYKAISIRRNV